MATIISMSVPITLGNITGSGSDGVLIGSMTATDPDKALLKTTALPCLCITDDGGLYVNETTPANESTADDVEIVGTTLVAGDAIYVGHATVTFDSIHISITTQGDYTDPVLAFKYWNGSAWTALTSVVDGTTAFEAAAGTVEITFDLPSDWARNTVDSVKAYWVQVSVTTITASVTPCQIGQIWVEAASANATWTDDTTDFTDAGAGDVALLPTYPIVNDGFYVGYSEKFCKLKITTSQARTGTATITLKYWNGSAWTAVTAATLDDDSVGYSATAGTHYVHFVPPSDWTANTASNGPDGEAGYFVSMELTAKTSVTQQPLLTQGWVYPISTGATGIDAPIVFSSVKIDMSAQTASATNADSTFILVNATKGTLASFAWTKATGHDEVTVSLSASIGDELVLVQIVEDGTTEFANANFALACC